MVLEEIDIPTGQIFLIADLLVEHLPQVLVRLLVLVFHQPLTELIHEVCSHSHDFGLIHRLFHLAVVGG